MSNISNALEYVARKLEMEIADALKAREDLSVKLMKSDHDALHAIKWMQGVAKVVQIGVYAREALTRMSDAEGEAAKWQALRAYEALIEDDLRRWSPEYSTSQFSNLVHADKYEALRYMHEKLAVWRS